MRHQIKLCFKQVSLQSNFIILEQTFLPLTVVFWYCFVFWKQCLLLVIKIQISNVILCLWVLERCSNELYKHCHKQAPKQCCLNPWADHYFTAEMGNILSQEEVDGIDRINTPWNRANKRDIDIFNNIIHSFHVVLWLASQTSNWHSNKMTQNSCQ